MIFSLEQLFSDQQVITASAASTNIIDTQATGTPIHAQAALKKDLGKGTPISISIRVTEDFATLTSLLIALEVDDNAGFSSAKVVVSESIAVAALLVGTDIVFQYIPKGTDERFLRLNYTVTGSNATTGKINAGIVAALDQGRAKA